MPRKKIKEKEVKKKKVKKKEKIILTRGKRKESIARAVVREGKGVIRINNCPLNAIEQRYLREIISEPLIIAGDAAKNLDIRVDVKGGGVMGQAEAARTAIARGIIQFVGDNELKKKMEEHDKYFVIEDARRVEPKKYLGPKARARFQKSYR
jgi:small subunit ribosomal protein S9